MGLSACTRNINHVFTWVDAMCVCVFCYHKSVASIVLCVCCSFVLLFHSSLFSALFSHSFCLFLFACSPAQGVGVLRSLLPTSLDEQLSMGQARNPRDIGDHSVCTPCTRAHFGRVTTACVSSPKRLGCLHWLAHAAGHEHLLGASLSGRSDPSVRIPITSENDAPKNWRYFPLRQRCLL